MLSDQLGQPQRLVDGFSTLTWDRVSDPFGATAAQAKGLSTAIALRFPGQEYDAITGLHYNDQRDYDPTLGRYIQPDPIGLNGGINAYAYVGDNPLHSIDPTGLIFIDPTRLLKGLPPNPPTPNFDDCDVQLANDIARCKGMGCSKQAYGACIAQANQRYAACLRGRRGEDLPPPYVPQTSAPPLAPTPWWLVPLFLIPFIFGVPA